MVQRPECAGGQVPEPRRIFGDGARDGADTQLSRRVWLLICKSFPATDQMKTDGGEWSNRVNEKTEATISALAAIFVILVALLDPRISVALSVIFLIALSIYKFYFADRKKSRN